MAKEYHIGSDSLLWSDFIKGNEDAFKVIYCKHVQSLFRFGCHITNDEALVKDCIHDVFIDLSKYRSGLGKTNNIKLYLLKSLKRKIIKSLDKRGIFGMTDPEKFPFYYCNSVEDDFVEDESERQRYQQLEKAMASLSERQKEAIYLKFVSNLSYDELSKVMKLNNQSARNLVFRGLEKLRESLPKNLFLFLMNCETVQLHVVMKTYF